MGKWVQGRIDGLYFFPPPPPPTFPSILRTHVYTLLTDTSFVFEFSSPLHTETSFSSLPPFCGGPARIGIYLWAKIRKNLSSQYCERKLEFAKGKKCMVTSLVFYF